jgi:hypothetical protein
MTDIDDAGVILDIEESTRLVQQREEAANRLDAWVQEREPANAAILTELAKDLRANRRLNEWGQFALEDLLRPPQRDPGAYLSHRVAQWLTFFRNLLLFAPVAATWFAIAEAAEEYQTRLSTLSVGVESPTFLQTWLDGSPSLYDVALFDFALIVVLIGLTFAAQMLETQADALAAKADKRDVLDFQDVLVRVGLFLHGFRAITPAALKTGLSEAVNALVDTNQKLRDTAERVATVSERANETLSQFATLSTTQLEPSVRRIDQIVGSLGGAVESHQRMSELVRTLQDNLGRSLGAINVHMENLGKGLERQLAENVMIIERALRGVVAETQDAGKQLSDAATAAREVASMFKREAMTR